MLLSDYDIQYVTQKSIKGSVLHDHLAHQQVEDYQPLKFDFPNEDITAMNDANIIGDDEKPKPREIWTIMFNGGSNMMCHGIGEVLMSPKNYHLAFTAKLYVECTNNIAEYEACILGLEEVIDLRIKILEVYRGYGNFGIYVQTDLSQPSTFYHSKAF